MGLVEIGKEVAIRRAEMRKLLNPVEADILKLQEQISSLGSTVAAQAAANYAGIVNILDNSLPEWSFAAYTGSSVSPATAGDGNLECHNFFRQLASDLALDTSTVAGAKPNALKAPKTVEPAEHSLFVANEGANADIPRWDKINGTMALGGVTNKWDIYTPLPNDIVFPGQTFYFQLEAKLASSLPDPDVQLYAGLYDNTVGQQKFIEGGAFTIDGEIFGDQSGTTLVDYQILARTDSGEEALSNVLSFTNAPSVFSGTNHPRINFAGVAGFIQFLIYRRIHGGSPEFVHQYTVGNTIEGTYYDIGNPPVAVVSGFPSVTTQKPRAYAVTTNFTPGSGSWIRHGFTIFVPTTYTRNLTGSGMQYLRLGLTDLCDEPRQILIRRLGLSQGDGNWTRSTNDLRSGVRSSPSTTAPGGSDSGGGDGGGGVDPPPPPGGGDPPFHECVLVDSMIDIADGSTIPLQRLDREYLHGGGAVHGRVRKLKMSHAARIYRIESENGCKLGCSVNHRLITNELDYSGTAAKVLKKRFDAGEDVWTLTRPDDNVVSSRIVKMEEEVGDLLVGTPRMDGFHIYIANGFLSHNRKPDYDPFA